MVAVKRGLMGGVRALKEGSQLSHVTRLHLPVTGHKPPWPYGAFLSPCPLTLPTGGTLFRCASSTPHLKQAESISSTGTVWASCELDAAVRQCVPPEAGAPSQRLDSPSPLSGPLQPNAPMPSPAPVCHSTAGFNWQGGQRQEQIRGDQRSACTPQGKRRWKLLAGRALCSAVNGGKELEKGRWVSYSAPSSASARVAPSTCDPDGTRPRPSVQGPVGANPESEANGGPESLRKGLNQTEVVPGQQSAAVEAPLTHRAYVLQLLSGQARERPTGLLDTVCCTCHPCLGSGPHGSMGTSLVVRVCLPQWP